MRSVWAEVKFETSCTLADSSIAQFKLKLFGGKPTTTTTTTTTAAAAFFYFERTDKGLEYNDCTCVLSSPVIRLELLFSHSVRLDHCLFLFVGLIRKCVTTHQHQQQCHVTERFFLSILKLSLILSLKLNFSLNVIHTMA